MLYSLQRLAQQTNPQVRNALGVNALEAILDQATVQAVDLRRQAEKELPATSDPQRAKVIRAAWGQARLVLADIALRRDQPQQALGPLENWEKDFAQDDDLLREGTRQAHRRVLR